MLLKSILVFKLIFELLIFSDSIDDSSERKLTLSGQIALTLLYQILLSSVEMRP